MTNPAKPISRPWRRFLRFSVRGLIVLVLVIGGWLGWIVRSARIQREAVAAIRNAGGEVNYDWEWTSGNRAPSQRTPALRWLVEVLGVDSFGRAGRVSVTPRRVVEFLARVRELQARLDGSPAATHDGAGELAGALIACKIPTAGGKSEPEPWDVRDREVVLLSLKGLTTLSSLDLRDNDLRGEPLDWLADLKLLSHLNLGATGITDSQLNSVQGLNHLSELQIDSTRVTDSGLVCLRGLGRLSVVNLARTEITDAGLRHLSDLRNLWELDLDGTRITDAGLVHLERLTKLCYLELRGTGVTDAGLVHLKGLTKLSRLCLHDTHVTDAGVNDLQKTLPNLHILR